MFKALSILLIATFCLSTAPARAASEYESRERTGERRRAAAYEAWRASQPKVDLCAPLRTPMSQAIAQTLRQDVLQYNCGVRGRKSGGQREWATVDQSYVCQLGYEMGIGWVSCLDREGRKVLAIRDSLDRLPETYNRVAVPNFD